MELRLHCAQSIILYLEEKHKLDCSTTYIKQYVNERDAVFAKYFPNISNKTNAKSLINTATMMEDMKVGKILFLKNYVKEIKEFYEAILLKAILRNTKTLNKQVIVRKRQRKMRVIFILVSCRSLAGDASGGCPRRK